MTTVFVYEDVCATGAGGDGKSPPAPSLLAEGRAMLTAITADFQAVPGVNVRSLGEPGASATGGCLSPVADAPGSPAFFTLVRSSDYTLVIAPECGGRLEYLCRLVLDADGKLLGPSPDAVRLTADKLALARHWERHGVTTPATWPLGEEPPGLAVVVKPRDGAGSQAMALIKQRTGVGFPSPPASGGEGLGVRGLRRAERREPPDDNKIGPLTGHPLAQDPPYLGPIPPNRGEREVNWTSVGPFPGPMIVQQYIRGFAASVAFLIGPDSLTPLVPCEQRLSDDGRFQYLGGRLPIPPDLAGRAVRVATGAVRCVPGLRGYVGVDVVLGSDGRDWAIEINPRLTTSYVGLRALARINLAGAMLAAVRGETMPELQWHSGTVEFTPDGSVRWAWGR